MLTITGYILVTYFWFAIMRELGAVGSYAFSGGARSGAGAGESCGW